MCVCVLREHEPTLLLKRRYECEHCDAIRSSILKSVYMYAVAAAAYLFATKQHNDSKDQHTAMKNINK